MADITDPTVVGFVNEQIRPLANTLARLYYGGRAIIDEYNERGGIAFLPNDAGSEVIDGAQGDSRPVITGQDATRVGQALTEFLELMEANGNEKLSHLLAVANQVVPINPEL